MLELSDFIAKALVRVSTNRTIIKPTIYTLQPLFSCKNLTIINLGEAVMTPIFFGGI
jgi:hypothetical protein